MQGAIKVARDGFRGNSWQPCYRLQLGLTLVVSSDLVRFMNAATTGGSNFLVDDPIWAVDFAPNGWSMALVAGIC